MTTLLIKNGHVVDPKNGVDKVCDLLVRDGQIAEVGKVKEAADQTVDATGQIVMPGLIDMQVHLREPGREDKETIETGLQAALAGGFTHVVSMPNTNPVADDQAAIEFQVQKAKNLNLAKLSPAGAITKEQAGKSLAEFREMKLAGAVAVTDDGSDVADAGLLEKAMEWAKSFNLPLLSHCEEPALHGEAGVMHEGQWSTRLGLPGVSAATEDLGVYRSVLLAQKTGAQFHALHCSTAGGLETLRQAKKNHKKITCETCPQYFALTDEVCAGYNTMAKMYPPIRSEDHRQAVITAIKDGTIDCITTDHAPHLLSEKRQPFTQAAFGSVGLETSLAVSYTHLVKAKHINLSRLVELMSTNPAQILRLPGGSLSTGEAADITIFDPKAKWTVDPSKFHSKGRNCVFSGMQLYGQVTNTIVDGEVRYNS